MLDLANNQIGDITPLASRTGLWYLCLGNNQISDIAPLTNLTRLGWLWLDHNQISDITPLSGITGLWGHLMYLYLGDNQISDIEPLVNNPSISAGDAAAACSEVFLINNPLGERAINVHIPALRARGVIVSWDDPVVVTIPDANLQAAIRQKLNKPVGDIHSSELAALTDLVSQSSGIINLSGLEYCTGLTFLMLNLNQINDIAPLSGLTSLRSLYLDNNHIINIAPLTNLTRIKQLGLGYNQINNLTPLVGLTNLTTLYLWDNQISDIEPLVNNPGLSAGDYVCLNSNPLNATSINVHIPALQARGVAVQYSVTNITTTSATVYGYLSSLDTFETMTVSFQWGTTPGSYSGNTTPQIMSSIGIFSDNLTGLTPATIYYFRSMGRPALSTDNEFDPIYGRELSFTTSGVPGQITTSTDTGTVTVQSNLGNITSLSAISAQTLPDPPPQVVFPHGLVYCVVSSITPGSTVIFTLTFPDALPADIEYWKYEPINGWFQIPIASQIGNVITIEITDGGLGDADGVANGVIIDPGGVAIPAAPTVTTGPGVYVSPSWFYMTGNLNGLGAADTSVTPAIEYWGPANGTWTLATMFSEGQFSTPTTLQTPPGAMPAGTYTFRAKVQGDQSLIWAYGDNATFIFQPSQPPTPTPTLPNPSIGTGAPTSHGSSVAGTITTQPMSLPNIQIQSASLSASKVAPGTPITVTADITNRSTVNGIKKITLYVNGQVETAQGITVNSGGTSKLTFYVTRSEPGDYTVYVDGVQAGSFKVESSSDSDIILWLSMACVLAALIMGAVYIMRWRRFEY